VSSFRTFSFFDCNKTVTRTVFRRVGMTRARTKPRREKTRSTVDSVKIKRETCFFFSFHLSLGVLLFRQIARYRTITETVLNNNRRRKPSETSIVLIINTAFRLRRRRRRSFSRDLNATFRFIAYTSPSNR